ncbi:hypothetical protein DOJK_02213 [Patescibacteria group bacterium]|nr:hypothetical protein DOJK_02213 [Patescibacteria group bacterium]
MLGHLKPHACQLSSDSKNHYQHLYCSLCFSLRQQFGLSASFLINHELTLSLASFPETTGLVLQRCACPAQFFCGEKIIVCDSLIDKAAQLSVLLVWLKLMDSQIDNPALYKQGLLRLLNEKVEFILADLSPETRQFIDDYLMLVRENNDFITTAKMSGLLAKQVFKELSQDNQHASISDITLLLGELITVADALLDVQSDLVKQQYNPIIEATKKNQSELKTEYLLLQQDYLSLAERIKQQLNNESINPLFKELLQQSLRNLTAKIYRANQSLFADNTNQQRHRRNRNNTNSSSDGFCSSCADCGECCNCFECCSDIRCGSANSGAVESSSGCCECCDCGCCDCGGCDCSC